MANLSNDEIRYQILEVLYNYAIKHTSWKVQRSYLRTKLNVDEKLIDFNIFYLHDRKLAKIVQRSYPNWLAVAITGLGIDVYEHKLNFANQYPFIKIAIQNISGDVYGGALQSVDSHVNVNEKITDSFKTAYSLIVDKDNLSDEEKTKIKENIEELEEEIKAEKPDKNKIQRLWDWIKANANWVIPTLKEIIEDILKTLTG